MSKHINTLCLSALTALAIGPFAVGTAAAQAPTPDPKTGGAYGGAAYGGTTYGAPTPPPPPTPVAEPAPVASPPPTYEEPAPMVVESEPSFYETWGIALSLGGGVEGFNDETSTGTDTGGNWNVRGAIGTRNWLGFEGSYIGSAQSIDAIGLDNSAVLVGNGLQGSLRLNLIPHNDFSVFFLGGLAWRHYNLTNEDFNTSDLFDGDDVLEIPVGAGLGYNYRGFLVDARGEYRFTSYGNMFDSRSVSDSDMDRWGFQANIGYQF